MYWKDKSKIWPVGGHTGRHTHTQRHACLGICLQCHNEATSWSWALLRSSGEILTLPFPICWEETFHFWVWLSEKADSSCTGEPAFWINTDLLIQKAAKSPLVWWIQLQHWVMSWKITLHRPVKAPLHDQTQHYTSWQQSVVGSYPLTNFFKLSQLLAHIIQVTIVSLNPFWEWFYPWTIGRASWAFSALISTLWQLWPGLCGKCGLQGCTHNQHSPSVLAGRCWLRFRDTAELAAAVAPSVGWGHSNHTMCTMVALQTTLDAYFWLALLSRVLNVVNGCLSLQPKPASPEAGQLLHISRTPTWNAAIGVLQFHMHRWATCCCSVAGH